VYVQGSPGESSTLDPDRPQHDRPVTCVIAQQYSSAIFVSLRFQSRKTILGDTLFFIFYFLNVLKSESVTHFYRSVSRPVEVRGF
jgi:hypothetical protein